MREMDFATSSPGRSSPTSPTEPSGTPAALRSARARATGAPAPAASVPSGIAPQLSQLLVEEIVPFVDASSHVTSAAAWCNRMGETGHFRPPTSKPRLAQRPPTCDSPSRHCPRHA